jgi:hypothetical protein
MIASGIREQSQRQDPVRHPRQRLWRIVPLESGEHDNTAVDTADDAVIDANFRTRDALEDDPHQVRAAGRCETRARHIVTRR